MSGVEYEPWQSLRDVTVYTPDAKPMYGLDVEYVNIPFAAAASAEHVVTMCNFLADRALKYLAGMKAIQEQNAEREPSQAYHAGLVGPLVRLRCTECECEWDGWVADDGTLEDRRDGYCTTAGCPKRGELAIIVEEEE